uniref:Uncharacterized protein n=1 Tax=Arundo donax TaxID=35708 RepID=A0A0A8XXY9_ARUDO
MFFHIIIVSILLFLLLFYPFKLSCIYSYAKLHMLTWLIIATG